VCNNNGQVFFINNLTIVEKLKRHSLHSLRYVNVCGDANKTNGSIMEVKEGISADHRIN
jgi:hypothetical protein